MEREQKQEKRVRFSRKVTLRRVPLSRHYTPSEKRSLWFQPAELEIVRENLKQTIILVANQELTSDTDEYCIRGTEIGIPCYIESRRQVKKGASTAVLEEWKAQREEGVSDPQKIREAYREFSQQCEVESHNQGLQDAIAVQIQYLEERAVALAKLGHRPLGPQSRLNHCQSVPSKSCGSQAKKVSVSRSEKLIPGFQRGGGSLR